MFRILLSVCLLACASWTIRAEDCPSAKTSKKTPATIFKTAAKAGQFKTLVSLVVAADLEEALNSKSTYTVFAPTDEAFAKLPKGTIETLLKPENQQELKSILAYHVIVNKDQFNYDHATPGQKYAFKTLNGSNLQISRGDGTNWVNDAKIVTPNVVCSNGSVQIINTVLMPPTSKKNTIPEVAAKAGSFKTLLTAVTTAELAEVLGGEGPFTVFAPTDEAFAKLPKGTLEKLLKPENRSQLVNILKYHVVSGKISAKELVASESAKTLQGEKVKVKIVAGRLQINQSDVVATDVGADNGVIHVIDRVLMPSH